MFELANRWIKLRKMPIVEQERMWQCRLGDRCQPSPLPDFREEDDFIKVRTNIFSGTSVPSFVPKIEPLHRL
jgi:hypothetical protein